MGTYGLGVSIGVSLSPRSCSWRRGLVGRMPSRARTGDRADGELPLQDSNLDYLIQSQACCQLHQGAPYPKTIPSARPGERRSKIKTVGSGEWYLAARYRTPGSHRRVPLPTPHALCAARTAAQGEKRCMELRGLEPLTSWVRSRRSPS